jgi:hypothetical protein
MAPRNKTRRAKRGTRAQRGGQRTETQSEAIAFLRHAGIFPKQNKKFILQTHCRQMDNTPEDNVVYPSGVTSEVKNSKNADYGRYIALKDGEKQFNFKVKFERLYNRGAIKYELLAQKPGDRHWDSILNIEGSNNDEGAC